MVEAGGAGPAPGEEPRVPSLAEHVAEWLAFQRAQVQPSTLDSYAYQLHRYVLPRLGHLRLDELTPRLLTVTWADLLESGGEDGSRLGLRTVKHAHDVLRNALEWAVDDGTLLVNPARKARPPRIDPLAEAAEEPFRIWTGQQMARFVALTRDHPLHLVFLLALSTGMRRGEILGLRWDDVDLDRAELHIRRALSLRTPSRTDRTRVRGAQQFVLKLPKTGRPRRIGIDQRLVDALDERRQRQALHRLVAGPAWEDRWGLVVTTEAGEPVYPSRVSAGFAKLLRRLDLPRIRFHDLRHSHASLLLQQGIPPHEVANRLGHAKPAMTLNVYAHVLPAANDRSVDRFVEAVYGSEAPADRQEWRFPRQGDRG